MRRGLGLFLSCAVLCFCACRRGNDAVIARVGKSAITEGEFHRKLGEVSSDYQNYVLTPHGRRQFLDVLIREKMILEVARADGIGSSSEFKDRMAELRKDEAEKLAEARDYLLTRLWLEKLRNSGTIKVGDEEVRAFYNKHPTEIVARHVLLPTADEAVAVLRRIRGGARFATVAQKQSLDADTAMDGGQMRPALFGEVIPELEGLFKMRVGEVSGPVRSKFGYHVLVKESEHKVPLNQAVMERFRSILEKQKLDQHLQSLQDAYPVEVVDAQFK